MVAVLLCVPFETNAQSGFDSSYLFEGTVADESSAYDLVLTGTESFSAGPDGQAFRLIGESYLDVSQSLGTSILTDESFFISIDFMMPDEGIDESARFIFGNKDTGYDTPGFNFTLWNEKTEWVPEGSAYINFNIGMGAGTEIAGRFHELWVGEWYTATFLVDFKTETVTFGLDERIFTHSLRESIDNANFDPEPFYQTLATHPVRIGGPKPYSESDPMEWHQEGVTATDHIAELHVDNLRLASPRPAGSASGTNSVLAQFTDHLNGTTPLGADAAEILYAELKTNLYGIAFLEIEAAARAFITSHNTNLAPLYDPYVDETLIRHADFPAHSRAYIALGLWMMREGLTTENAWLAEGITFQEHTGFPGAVSESAERVAGGTAAVKAVYVKDLYYTMGDMQVNEVNELSSYVYRPTGYWAPAGEAVQITVPANVVNSGLHIRVGAHKYDHMVFSNTNRMPLLKVDYRIESESFEVINPMGGGIYVLVPMGTDLGWMDIQIDGAVRSPFYSMREGYLTTASEWDIIQDYPGPLADFESDKYMFTVPSAAIRDFNAPDEILGKWNEAMDVVQLIHGRPLERVRAEAFMFDTRTSVEGSYPGGYPVTPGLWSQIDGDIKLGGFSPFGLVNGSWTTGKDEGTSIMLHEMSHHHAGYVLTDPDNPTQTHEIETFNNVPWAAIMNVVLDQDLDTALKYSTYQKFSRLDAAIDWMVTTNFRNGDPIGWDPTTDFQPAELPYQSRGSAKYLDLADIFGGWEALGAIYKTFYEEDVARGIPVTDASQPPVSRDHFLENGSNELSCNLASLFHFWGIHESDDLAAQLSLLQPCDGAAERVKYYLSNAPRTNEDLRLFHAEKLLVEPYQLKPQIWEPLLLSFDTTEGQQIRTVGAQILSKYFDIEANEAPSTPVLLDTEFNLAGAPSDLVTFSWTPSVDPEGEKLLYSWRLFDTKTGETLVSRSWVDGTQVEIQLSELSTALDSYTTSLSQEVTTSDLFTVVTSQPLASYHNVIFSNDEYGDSCAEAASVLPDSVTDGTIGSAGDHDLFRFELDYDTVMYMQTVGETDTFGVLRNADCGFMRRNDDGGSGFNTRIATFLPAGVYYLDLSGYAEVSTGPYQLKMSTLDDGPGVDLTANLGMNDAWFNLETPGQGFFVTVFPQYELIFASWFTHETFLPDASVANNLGDPGHRWYTAFGSYYGNEAFLEIELTTDGLFNSDKAVEQSTKGSLYIRWNSCADATFAFDLPDEGLSGSIPAQRAVVDHIAACEELGHYYGPLIVDQKVAKNSYTQAVDPVPGTASSEQPGTEVDSLTELNYGLNDAWYNPLWPGQGFFVTVLPEIKGVFVSWFTFDNESPDGQTPYVVGSPGHRWFTALGFYEGNRADMDIELTTNGLFNDPLIVEQGSAGTMSIQFDDCYNGRVSYSLDQTGESGEIPIVRVLVDESIISGCEDPQSFPLVTE